MRRRGGFRAVDDRRYPKRGLPRRIVSCGTCDGRGILEDVEGDYTIL
jgi:hypothetical protein